MGLPRHLSEEFSLSVPSKLIDLSRHFQAPALENLRANKLLQEIPDAVLSHFARLVRNQVVEGSDTIFEEGDRGVEIYLILEGAVKISKKGRGGHQESLAHLQAGDFFGEMALIDGSSRSAQASAAERAVLAVVDEEAWRTLLQLAPQQVLRNFGRSTTQRLRNSNEHFIKEMLRTERLSLLGSTVSSIIHDINNPMTSIFGACEYIARSSTDALVLKMTGIIQQSVERMHAMNQELLDFSRGTANLSLERTPVMVLVNELEQQELAKAGSCKIRFEKHIHFAGYIRVDHHRMIRLLGNLIKNAREAMCGGGTITLFIDKVEDVVIFKVSDTGHGISPEHLSTIFEPFVTYGKAKGTGLGLAITKSMVEAHRGTITVTSALDKGTTFEVRIPCL